MQLTIDDNGSEQTIDVAEPIDIELPERPTTGYRWFLSEDSPFEIVEDQTQVEHVPPGKGGLRRIRVRALQKGRLELRLVERRRWGQQISRDFTVTVVVR